MFMHKINKGKSFRLGLFLCYSFAEKQITATITKPPPTNIKINIISFKHSTPGFSPVIVHLRKEKLLLQKMINAKMLRTWSSPKYGTRFGNLRDSSRGRECV